jgi:acyl-CoA thioesterase
VAIIGGLGLRGAMVFTSAAVDGRGAPTTLPLRRRAPPRVPPVTRFDDDTAIEARGDGRFTARIDPSWWIVRGPNGGYVAAIVLRALTAVVEDPDRPPRSLTVHYLRPPAEGPVEVDVTVERAGRSLSTLSARLVQGGRTMALALAAFGARRPAPAFADRAMPDAPPPEACERRVPVDGTAPPAIAHWDQRFAVGSLPMSGGEAVSGGWIAPAEARPVDPVLVAAVMDAWVPPIFCRLTERPGVPTVDLTVHFRADLPPLGLPEDGHLLAVFRSEVAAEGYVTEDGELWSPSGVLLAESRQLALVL